MANKLKRDNFTMNELEATAKTLDCEFEGFFADKYGENI